MVGRNIPCIVCAKPLVNLQEDRCENQPSGGVEFTTPGHYGCTIFDPMDGTKLAINICDPCLRKAAEYRRVLVIDATRQYDTWKP